MKDSGRYGPCLRRFFLPHECANYQHEWAAHGTCSSTLEPSCLPPSSPKGAEAVAYFQSVVALFQTLPTYNWLASAGITPSDTQTYVLSHFISALKTASGGVRHRLSSSILDIVLIGFIYSSRHPLDAPDQRLIILLGISILEVLLLMARSSRSVRSFLP